MKLHNIGLICLAFLSPGIGLQAQTAQQRVINQERVEPSSGSSRTVMNTEFGSIFAAGNGFPKSDFGAYIGASYYSTDLNPDAVKGHYGQFHVFASTDSGIGFPYAALRSYDAAQMALGEPSLFVTATYAGKSRPVLFAPYLKLNGSNKPTSSPSTWKYLVNVRDPRYITFWITQYAQPIITKMEPIGFPYMYCDNVTSLYTSYGVLDDNNVFHAGVTWNANYPQSGPEFQDAMATFFQGVAQQAPGLNIFLDTGSMANSPDYQNFYANVPGMLTENVYGWAPKPDGYVVDNWYNNIFQWFSWASAQGKVTLFGAFLPSNYENGALRDSFVVYELLKGVNSFFAPRVGGTALPMSAPWLGWTAKLGSPVAQFQSTQLGSATGNRLFSRQYANGYVYLNWTGSTQTVTLPSGTTWHDPNGNVVTSLSIPTFTGSFVNQ